MQPNSTGWNLSPNWYAQEMAAPNSILNRAFMNLGFDPGAMFMAMSTPTNEAYPASSTRPQGNRANQNSANPTN